MAMLAALGVIGAFLGFLYVAWSWRGKASLNVALKDDLRVRGLSWALTGAGIVLIADWQKFVGTNIHIERTELLGWYAGGFLSGVFSTLFVTSINVWSHARLTNKTYPDLFIRGAFSPVLHYLFYGFKDYTECVERCLKDRQANDESASALEAAISAQRDHLEASNKAVIAAFDAYESFVRGQVSAADTCHNIMRQMIQVVQSFLGMNSNHVNASYMVVEKSELLDQTALSTVKFAFGDLSRYREYLCLKGYAHNGPPMFRIPVEPDGAGRKHRLLPGAPKAYVLRRPEVTNTRKPKFEKEVPTEVRDEQILYFETQEFDAIYSLPLRRSGTYNGDAAVVGILNLDFQLEREGLDADELSKYGVEVAVSPFCALLASIIEKEKQV